MSDFCESSVECDCETTLDDGFDDNAQDNQFGELTKHIGNMFNNPNMQNALKGVFNSLKQKSGSSLTKEDIAHYSVSYEDINQDINNRLVPHLLSRLHGEGLNDTLTVTINKDSKQFGSISLLYGASNYLISKGNDQAQIELYRDRLVGQMVWMSLYNADNYYEKPSEETNKLISTTMQEFASGVVTNQLTELKLDELFKQFNTLN